MKNFRTLFACMFLLLSADAIIAQDKMREGRVVFEITYPEMEMDSQMEAMMPTESVMYIRDHMSRTETRLGMGISSATIMNSKTNEIISLMDMMGTKTATIVSSENNDKGKDKSHSQEMKFELLNETKEIAGMVCKKAIMKNSDGTDFEMYYTDLIDSKSQFSRQWKDFKGFPMEYLISSGGFNMKMTAKTVIAENVPEELFNIPTDYKIMTEEEFSKMMGGQ